MSELKQPRMSPGMREALEAAMELSGQPQRPSFLPKMFRPAQSEQGSVIDELVEALDEAEDYFENRADADYDQDGYVPNKEMVLLTKIRAALSKAKPSQGDEK